jgi:hypothetical protein
LQSYNHNAGKHSLEVAGKYEYEEESKKISFELARLVVQAESNDAIIKLMLRDPKFSVENIAAFLGVSVRFVEISIDWYMRRKKEEPESDVTIWEPG